MSLFVRVPPSTKLRVASCHIDFLQKGISADAASVVSKAVRINELLEQAALKPHLIVFPEGADCAPVRGFAKRWATELGATTICGSSQDTGRIQGTIVRPHATGSEIIRFDKRNLSPYDAEMASSALVRGGTAGVDLVLNCPTVDGDSLPVNIRVLICYDFRFHWQETSNFNTTQVVVVPMHDRRHEEPEGYAGTLAKRHYVRTLLVNKAEKTADGKSLPSSAFGPLSDPFAKHLADSGGSDTSAKDSRLWRVYNEGVTLGEYEVGQPCAPGHDTAYGAGFFYRVEHHAL